MYPDLHTISKLMILVGSVLMILNIYRYFGFTRRMRWMAEGRKSRLVLYVPLLLLLFFLLGYLAMAFFGSPNLVMAGILLGGSVFVLIILSASSLPPMRRARPGPPLSSTCPTICAPP